MQHTAGRIPSAFFTEILERQSDGVSRLIGIEKNAEAAGEDFSAKGLHLLDGFAAAFQSLAPNSKVPDLLVGIAIAGGIRLAVNIRGINAWMFRKNMEYRSACRGKPDDLAPFIAPECLNNVILTQTERLMMSNMPKAPTRTCLRLVVPALSKSGFS
ncbi:hypothetical protein HCH52_03830 [Oscillospiraceae bacterium HV4-5-C5C]|nr:hypothetical protein [Oscillospiraceae bacterium HV4-5-C5C]